MKLTLYDYCHQNERTELLEQWDQEKNEPLTPKDVTYGSNRRAWWRCEIGHQWQAMIGLRVCTNTGCPSCAKKIFSLYPFTLDNENPELASQWHPTKNGNLTPKDVSPRAHKKVWWICDKGHEWQAEVCTRTYGTGCPVCVNVVVVAGENDLATTHPEIAASWHPSKNGDLTPQMVSYGSGRRIWWLCPKGHEWQVQVCSRTHYDAKCPYCAGRAVVPGDNDLASRYPRIAAEWHPSKNGTLRADQVMPHANRKVWWLCPKGHEYQTLIKLRTIRGTGCPVCAGIKILAGFNDLATLHPKIAAQWHPTLNENLTPEMVGPGSNKKVWWQCSDGHIWEAVVYSRTGPVKCGCPVCAGKISKKKAEYYKKIVAEKKLEQRAEESENW